MVDDQPNVAISLMKLYSVSVDTCCVEFRSKVKIVTFEVSCVVSCGQLQTRSADEPMTTFVLCNECGNRWKVKTC